MSASHSAILFLICFSVAANAKAQGVPDLKTVVERTQNYVKAYEEQLGTLIGQEDYNQTAKWDSNTTVWNGTRRSGMRVGMQRRRMSSDFLLSRIEGQWFGVRNVLTVDQRRIDGKPADFGRIMAQSPPRCIPRRRRISRVSTAFSPAPRQRVSLPCSRPESHAALDKAGVENSLRIFAGADHDFYIKGDPAKTDSYCVDAYNQMVEWFQKHL